MPEVGAMLVRRAAAAAAAAIALAIAGCGDASQDGNGTARGSSTQTPVETWDLVVLADSSGWGLGDAWAELIRRDLGVEVNVTDLSTGLQSGGGLLEHLRTEGDPQREAVRDAEIISVWGSPGGLVWKSDFNDCVMYPDGKRPPTRLSRQDFEPYAQLWRDILAEINALRTGQPTAVRVRDLYSPVISQWIAAGTAEACSRGMAMMTATAREAARLAGAEFIPVYRAFNGPDGMQDPKERDLFIDMEHLNDRGVALMARLHHEAGYGELLGE
jgi:hypothetical protein